MEGSCWCQTDGANIMPSWGLNIVYKMDQPRWRKSVGFCDLLGTPYAPVSKIPPVKNFHIFQDANTISEIIWLHFFGVASAGSSTYVGI